MYIPSPRSKRKARIEIIPLIDIIFFLLATFMMVSLSMIQNKGISVQLPVASTGTAQERTDYVVITVTEKGDFYFDKEKTNLAGMMERLKQAKSANPDLKVFMNGDEKALLGTTVTVLDEIRKLGITKVAIETKPAPQNQKKGSS